MFLNLPQKNYPKLLPRLVGLGLFALRVALLESYAMSSSTMRSRQNPTFSHARWQVDVLELRVDLLDSGIPGRPHDEAFVLGQVAALKAASNMPILFTVRR